MQQILFPSQPVVAFLTDFGLRDGYVGVLKGVVLGIAPQAQLIDITHDIPPQDIAAGAWVLGTSYRYFPLGTIYICVVDPGVGSARRPIAVRTGDWLFVGPDNGLLSYVLAEQPIHEAVVLREFGIPLDPSSLSLLALRRASRQEGRIQGHSVYTDHFGNLITNIPASLVPDLFSCIALQLTFSSQKTIVTERRRFFAENSAQDELAARPFIYVDSAGYIGVAIQNGSAAATLGVRVGDSITLLITNE